MNKIIVTAKDGGRRSRFASQLLAVFVLWMSFGGAVEAVEVTSVTKVKSLEWLWNGYGSMTFSPDGAHFLLAEQLPDGYNHLCAYEAASHKKIKCIVRLYESKNSSMGEIDWPDDRLFVTTGGFDESFVGWLNIRGWQDAKFQEVDAKQALQFVKGKEGTCPAWDRKEGGLYFGNGQPYGGIFFEKNGIQSSSFENGVCAIPEEKYIWYTEHAETGIGLRRQERATKKVQIIIDGSRRFSVTDFSVSPQGRVLYVRSDLAAYAALYAYVEGQGIQGPLFGPVKDGLIKFIRISPTGDRALVSVHDEKNSTDGRNRHHVYMLGLRWK